MYSTCHFNFAGDGVFVSIHAGERESASVPASLHGVSYHYVSQYLQVSAVRHVLLRPCIEGLATLNSHNSCYFYNISIFTYLYITYSSIYGHNFGKFKVAHKEVFLVLILFSEVFNVLSKFFCSLSLIKEVLSLTNWFKFCFDVELLTTIF